MARSGMEHHIERRASLAAEAGAIGACSGLRGQAIMSRIWKALLVLILLGLLGLVGYAYFGDIAPTVEEVSEPVQIDAQ